MRQASLFPELDAPVREPVVPRRPMRLVVLGSGSEGNAVVIEAGGRRLLVDAGFSAREIKRRLAKVGLEPEDLHGVVLTHEHLDHVRGVERFCRKRRVPILEVRSDGKASLDMWCHSAMADVAVSGDEIKFTVEISGTGQAAEYTVKKIS